MRQIALDTETTGIGHEQGHRIIEIAAVEMLNRKLTGNHFHVYINPQRLVDEGAFRVHGISHEFLADKPLFADIAEDFITFIRDSELIIHNAPFDVGFLNAELRRCHQAGALIETYCSVFDTLALARKQHPGQRNNLDALCKRYDIDNSHREKHGALIDAEILAEVYLAMTGGQGSFWIEENTPNEQVPLSATPPSIGTRETPIIYANAEELQRHQEYVDFLIQTSKQDRWT